MNENSKSELGLKGIWGRRHGNCYLPEILDIVRLTAKVILSGTESSTC